MSCLLGIFRRLFGQEEDDNIAYRMPYGFHSRREYSEHSARILSSYKVPAQDEFLFSSNTSSARLNNQSSIETTNSKSSWHPLQTPNVITREVKFVAKDAIIASESSKRKPENLSEAFGKPNVLTSKPHDHKLSSNISLFSSQPPPSSSKPPAFASKAPLSSYKSSPHLSGSPPSALIPSSSDPETPLRSGKPTLSQAIHGKKANHILDNSASPTYKIVGNLEDWINKDFYPGPPRSSLKADSSSSSSQTLFSSPKPPQSYLDSFEAPKITTREVKTVAKDATIRSKTIKRELEKSNEAFGKPKELDKSSTLTCGCGKVTINLDVNNPNDHKLSSNSSPFSSQLFPSSSKPPAVVSKAPSSSYKSPQCLSGSTPPALIPSSSSSLKTPILSSKLQKKANHNVDKSSSPTCIVVDNFEDWIRKDFPSAPPRSPLKPDSSSSSSQTPVSSPKPPRCSRKPTLSEAPRTPTINQRKTNYSWVQKGTSSIYKVPENVEDLIKKDILPQVLKKPLSPSTYKDFFHTLLYAEDYYIERWDGFIMQNVTLEVEEAVVYSNKGKGGNLNQRDLEEEDDRVFVAFEMDSVPEKRPFLLSRDFASVRPSCSGIEPFQGIIYRVVKSNKVLVEFGEDFLSQHHPDRKYDVKFSFNRICLKRAHQAIITASDCLLKKFLFPNSDCSSSINPLPTLYHCTGHKLDAKRIAAVRRICDHNGPPPYLLEGPPCIIEKQRSRTVILEKSRLSSTGVVIREAVLQTYRTNPGARILICAPSNVTCDLLVESLQEEIPESEIFRANAAFREIDEVLLDILPSCRFKGECFSCPSLEELRKFKVISSTYMSCFRLHNEGLVAGEFSQMFLLDASSTTEPETLVALANFADESTNVVVTGTPGKRSCWVRSSMARRKGLMRSYFERLRESKLYESLDPNLISQV